MAARAADKARRKTLIFLMGGFLLGGASWLRAADPLPALAAQEEYGLGLAAYQQKNFAAAAGHFQKAGQLAPGSSLYAQWLGRAYGLQARDASLLSRPGLASRSRESLERAVQLDPDNLAARSDLAAYYAAAPGFMGGGAAKANTQVAEIRRRDPYLGDVRAGDLAWDDHRPVEAEQAYRAAAQTDPRRAEAHGRLGFFYLERGQHAQAFEHWDAMLGIDPSLTRALYGLGKTAALSKQRTADGVAALRSCLENNKFDPDGPSAARAHYYLGVLLDQSGERAAARGEYESALRLDPKMTDAKDALSQRAR